MPVTLNIIAPLMKCIRISRDDSEEKNPLLFSRGLVKIIAKEEYSVEQFPLGGF